MKRLALLLVLIGCVPNLVDVLDSEPFDPPHAYAVWHDEAKACSGLRGDFDAIRWFTVPGDTWYDGWFQRELAGRWVPPHDIYIAEGARDEGWLVIHEMLHDLKQDGEHPDPPFGTCDIEGGAS